MSQGPHASPPPPPLTFLTTTPPSRLTRSFTPSSTSAPLVPRTQWSGHISCSFEPLDPGTVTMRVVKAGTPCRLANEM